MDEKVIKRTINGHKLPTQHNRHFEVSREGPGEPSGPVDLTSVLWAKLPPNLDPEREEKISAKISAFLSSMRNSGHDVLIVPITGGFTNPRQVMQVYILYFIYQLSCIFKKCIVFQVMKALLK